MANVFHTHKEVHIRYDLKGSTYGRFTPEDDPSIAKKDLDIIKRKDSILLSKFNAELFLGQIGRDCAFFEQNNIIDYSLLIGIHHNDGEKLDLTEKTNLTSMVRESAHKKHFEEKFNQKEGILSADGKHLYFIGIIDVLTRFNSKKKLEYAFKRVVYGSGISAVPPKQYSERFQKFITTITKIA